MALTMSGPSERDKRTNQGLKLSTFRGEAGMNIKIAYN